MSPPAPDLDETLAPVPGTDATCFIQWKGTEVCMDLYCECGAHGHVDGFFMYAVRCPSCGAVYEAGTQVLLRRVEPAAVGRLEGRTLDADVA